MKRFIKSLSVALLIIICTTISVQAVDSWKWYQDIKITDTSGTTRTNVSVLTGIKGTNLVSAGYIWGSGFNSRMKASDGTTDVPFMIDTTNTALVLPTLSAYQSYVARFYYGYSPNVNVTPIILGYTGYVTTPDNAALEPGNNFTVEINGFMDLSNMATYLMNKSGAVGIHTTNNAGEIAVQLNGSDILTVSGQNQIGLHDYIVNLYGGTLTLKDGASTIGSIGFGGSVVDNSSNFVWLGNTVPYANYIIYSRTMTTLLEYQPNDAGGIIVQGTTMKDTQHSYDGTITWGTNSNLDISVGPITSYQSNVSGGGTSVPNNVGTITPIESYPSGAATTLPFYDSFNNAATSMGMTTQTLYVMVALGLAAAFGLMVLVFTGSTLIAAVVCGAVIAAGTSANVLATWMLIVYIILGGGLLFLSRQV